MDEAEKYQSDRHSYSDDIASGSTGAGHGSIGLQYEERKRFDYFVGHLQGGSASAWNQLTGS